MTRLLITLIFTALGNFGHILYVQTAMAAEFPPSIVREQAIHERLQNSYIAKGKEYTFRSQYKVGTQPKYVNRLIEEVSPYLLQHAHNPVEWYPWSSKTLDIAKAENKPIFLSVGYATCHWCHVMERESFDQEDVAKVLNENFISIKIDREQYPDIDQLYLTATQLQQGQGGWPNTLWLTPDGKPFHTGTYFTKEELIRTSMILAEGWRSPSARSEIYAVANGLSSQVMQIVGGGQAASVSVGPVLYEKALNGLLEKLNDLEGGFSETNQFPQESYLLFLLDHWRRGGPEEALDAVVITLDAIVAGGIHDHVGGGFHRYAIDPGWHTPHFEKMLYNQALLSRVFLETWEVTGKNSYRRAVERTLQYVIRDMTAKNGAFFAAEDADSLNADNQNEEGAFYTWQADELLMGLNNNREVAIALGLDPNTKGSEPFVLKMDVEETPNFNDLDNGLEQLLKYRSSRAKPFKDTKIIAGWNGLMIRSLASAGKALNNKTYVDAAERAANTVWNEMWDGQHLARFHIDGITNGTGLLEDYVWLALGFVTLSDVTGDLVWLDRSKRLANAAWTEFATDRGRLKQASLDGPLGPVFGAIDDATPSAESSALELFGLLVHRTGDLRYYGWSQKLVDGLSMMIARQPDNLSYALLANNLPLEGQSTLRQVRGNGNVKIQLTRDKLVLDIKEGWHLSAHVPGYDYLIGTKIMGANAQWPVGRKVKLGFASQEALVYEGKLEIPLKLISGNIALTVQACSDQICLTPEEANFRLLLK